MDPIVPLYLLALTSPTDAAPPPPAITDVESNIPPAEVILLREELSELRSVVDEMRSYQSGATEVPFSQSISATGIYQSLDRDAGNTDFLSASLDLVLEAPLWEGAAFVLDIEASGGDGADGDTPSFGGWNADAGSLQSADGLDRLHVLEALVTSPVLDDELFATFGKVDLGGFFDPNALANDETIQFLYGGFVNSAAFEAPDPGAALVLSYLPASSWDLNLAVASADNSGEKATSELFTCLQVGLYPELAGRSAECFVYTWQDGSREGLVGVGLSASLELSETWSLFGRYGQQEDDPAFTDAMDSAFSIGCQWLCAGDDNLGLAYGSAESADTSLDAEDAWELYYRHPINHHIAASLHLQGIDHPGGNPAESGDLALGLRLQLDV